MTCDLGTGYLLKVFLQREESGRLVSVSSPPYGEGTDLRYGCQLIGSMQRAFGGLPEDWVSFLCHVRNGMRDSRLRHREWEKWEQGSTNGKAIWGIWRQSPPGRTWVSKWNSMGLTGTLATTFGNRLLLQVKARVFVSVLELSWSQQFSPT